MKAMVALRRMVGGAILTAFLIPLITSGAPGVRASVRPIVMAGTGACCAEKSCCVGAHVCGTGECPMAVATGASDAASAANAPEACPRLAASCPGPAPATTPSERDPMMVAPVDPPSIEPTPVLAAGPFNLHEPARTTAPSVPPPRV